MLRSCILIIALATACKGKDSASGAGSGSAGSGSAAANEATREKSIKDDLVGTDPKKLAFEPAPMLGMTREQVAAAYDRYKIDKHNDWDWTITIPGGNYFPGVVPRRRDLDIRVTFQGNAVTSYWIPTDHTLRKEIVDALTTVRGQPTPFGADIEKEGVRFGTGPVTEVTIEPSGGFLKILVAASPTSEQP